MAQGSQKFKAQRAGATKKQHQNKQKGPKKGGTVGSDVSLLLNSHEEESESFRLELHVHHAEKWRYTFVTRVC